jgi:RHS repeat-associated protein
LVETYHKPSGALPAKVQEEYVWGLRYIDSPVVLFYWNSSTGTLIRTQYYCNDANFNVTAVVDTDGEALERYRYDPYGRPGYMSGDFADWGASPQGCGNRVLYAGYLRDKGTGLYLARNRYYHPTLGRWVSRDPNNRDRPGGGYQDGMNLYEYGRSSPTRGADPYGLEWEVERIGLDTARATAKGSDTGEATDTIKALADLIGLEAKDVKAWAGGTGNSYYIAIKTTEGSKFPWELSETDVVCPGSIVRIPNTVIAYWAEYDKFGDYQSIDGSLLAGEDFFWVPFSQGMDMKTLLDWYSKTNTLKTRGFRVLEREKMTPDQLKAWIKHWSEQKVYHGFMLEGHGSRRKGLVRAGFWADIYKKKDDDTNLFLYKHLKPAYKPALGILMACYSDVAKENFSASPGRIFFGFGYHFSDKKKQIQRKVHPLKIYRKPDPNKDPSYYSPMVSDLVSPGAQGTKKE